MPVVCSDDASDTGGPMNSRWNCAFSVSLSPSNALKIESKTLSFSLGGGPWKSLEVGSFYGDKALQGTFWCALIISGNKSLAVEHVLWNYVLRHKKQPGMFHSTKASFWPPCILGWRPEGWETPNDDFWGDLSIDSSSHVKKWSCTGCFWKLKCPFLVIVVILIVIVIVIVINIVIVIVIVIFIIIIIIIIIIITSCLLFLIVNQ